MTKEQMLELLHIENIAVIDQHKLWMEHYDESAPNYGQGDWLADGDSCHPTDIGHEAIADYMIKSQGYELTSEAKDLLLDITDLKRKEPNFANAREVRNILE